MVFYSLSSSSLKIERFLFLMWQGLSRIILAKSHVTAIKDKEIARVNEPLLQL